MARAVSLSRRGFPAPNPRVGCVLLSGDRLVGEGYHAAAGGPHAEVVALGRAGAAARGAHAYVTLEPCDHEGRTGPCSLALLAAGVEAVTYAVADPNPRAAGGAARLRAAGVRVEAGLGAAAAEAANLAWLTAVRRGSPFVVLKCACSLDGFAAPRGGERVLITGPRARAAGRRLRAECGAVLVGRGTVERDDPRLTARTAGAKNEPTRVVLDPGGTLPGTFRVFDGGAPALRVQASGGDVTLPLGPEGFDLGELMRELYRRGVTALLVEGGPTTLGRFLRAGLVDRAHLFVAPSLLGDGLAWSGGAANGGPDPAARLELLKVRRLEPDVELVLRPEG